MTLKERINEEIKNAMRAKNQGALRALRAIKSAILIAETADGATGDLSPDQELKILGKQAKQRKDSIEQFLQNGRNDLVAIESEELEIIEQYLPKALSQEELKAAIEAIIAETGANSMKDMGRVMGLASTKLAGQADGKDISMVVKSLLS